MSGRSAPKMGGRSFLLCDEGCTTFLGGISTGTACLLSILRPVGWKRVTNRIRDGFQKVPTRICGVFGGASVIVGSETNVNSGGGAAWLDDASHKTVVKKESRILMSPPLISVEVKRARCSARVVRRSRKAKPRVRKQL